MDLLRCHERLEGARCKTVSNLLVGIDWLVSSA